jgi:ERCC4-type nuclease
MGMTLDLPTIRVDMREGSKTLVPLLENTCNVIQVPQLPAGDFMWRSRLRDGSTVKTLCEYKTFSDFLASKRDGRLLEQVVGMLEYGDRNILLIEGDWGLGPKGMAVVRSKEWKNHRGIMVEGGYRQPHTGTARPPTFAELSGFLWELQYIAGFQIWRSMTKDESAALVAQACRLEWKSWKEHDALGVDGVVGAKMEKVTPSGGPKFMTPGKCWRMAAQIDGLGSLASYTEHGFDTPHEMVNASIETWEAVLPAKQKWRARDIYRWLRER